MIELSVYSVLYSLLARHRVVLLKEVDGERFLPIWIGQYESEAIAMRLQGASVPRPLTHDLLVNVVN
ncbi:MAG TPA: bifunctional nuclease family protein, partial [Chloroflexi bacterium]|nr:bifunctional nuclease family protein [Chloroflexota bacterium]